MAASDTTTAMMLHTLKEIQEQRRAGQERLRTFEVQCIAAEERLQKFGEQRLAAEERSRSDMYTMLKGLHTRRVPAAISTSADRFPSLKTDFMEFTGEPEEWNTWSGVLQAQLCAFGRADALTAKDDDHKKIGSSEFKSSGVDPKQLRAVHQAWVSLITTCKGVAFDIV